MADFTFPTKTDVLDFLKDIIQVLDWIFANYEHLFIMSDFNLEIKEKRLAELCRLNNLKNFIKMPYFKIHLLISYFVYDYMSILCKNKNKVIATNLI